MYEVGFENWKGFECYETFENKEEAIAYCESLYAEDGLMLDSYEEAYIVVFNREEIYCACGEE